MKLLIVDDDTLILKSLSISLSREDDIEIIGCASDGAEALKKCVELKPDVILMDIRMPGVDGIAATRLIKQQNLNVRIMMLTTFEDKASIQQAISAGADGYLIKTDKVADIAGKLRILIEGAGILDAEVLKKLMITENSIMDNLTVRERTIIRLVAQGLTNKEIALQLYLSEGTVRNNIVVLMEKLSVTNRTQLSLIYYQKI